MPKAIVVANSDKPRALELAGAAERELRALGAEVRVSTARDEDLSGEGAHLAVVFGGDGTVLGAVASLGENPPAVLAFNIGHLGYLAENPPEGMRDILREAFAGRLQASRRMLLEGGVDGGRRTVALNEFVVSHRQSGRPLAMTVTVGGEELMRLRGDGVIIATPTGSTAYSLSAGGPVVSPEVSAIVFTPLCPHHLANRPLVLDTAEILAVTHESDMAVEVVADGRQCLDLEPGRELTVGVSPRSVTFLRQTRGRHRLLREKLGWGWRVDG